MGRSAGSLAALKRSGGFPLPIEKLGRTPVVSIYLLAEWLAGEYTPSQSTKSKKTADSNALPAPARKRVKIGDFLLALRQQNDFLGALYSQLEALEIMPPARRDK
jgi:hypothetical protein